MNGPMNTAYCALFYLFCQFLFKRFLLLPIKYTYSYKPSIYLLYYFSHEPIQELARGNLKLVGIRYIPRERFLEPPLSYQFCTWISQKVYQLNLTRGRSDRPP